ncbi:MAG: penicillin-binding protein activator [Alphaproteobacteria bacterium]|nr:penicillin-binding protein activator [Alphaproteobacteria bacterium]
MASRFNVTKPAALAMALGAALFLGGCQGGITGGPQAPQGPAAPGAIGGPSAPILAPGMPIPADPAGYVQAPGITGEPIRVALLLPFTHPSAEAKQIAQALLDSAQLAVIESGNRQIFLMPRDTKGTIEGAQAAANQALAEGAEIVLGPLFAQTVTAAAPIVKARNIPMIAFSTDRAVASQGVYLLSFQAEEEVASAVRYARAQGRTSFAGLFPASAYGQRVQAAFEKAVGESGGMVMGTALYGPTPQEMLAAVRSLPRGFDAVLLPEGGQALRTLAPLLPFNNIDPRTVKFLGTGLWDDRSILSEPSIKGGWFAAPDPIVREGFAQRFKETYGYTPPRIASLAYDAISLVNTYAAGAPYQRYQTTTFLDPNGYQGIDGIFRFRPDGTIERGLAIIEVTETGFETIGAAPVTFQAIGF